MVVVVGGGGGVGGVGVRVRGRVRVGVRRVGAVVPRNCRARATLPATVVRQARQFTPKKKTRDRLQIGGPLSFQPQPMACG